MNEVPKRRWGCLQWGIVVGGLVLVASLFIPVSIDRRAIGSIQMRCVHNCRSIILTLKQYSMDNGSSYPGEGQIDRVSANQVFRELFKEQIITDERVFGCPVSVFNSDNNSGHPPSFEDALMPGECHWMLLRDQTPFTHAKTPLIIENSRDTSWPPKWDVSPPQGIRKRGQAWQGRRIIIGRNDGSVALEKLREDGTMDWHSPSNLDEHGKSWIDSLKPEEIAQLSYWEVEEK